VTAENTTREFSELLPKIRPGDVVISGSAESINTGRLFVGSGSAEPDVYHTSLVESADRNGMTMLDHTDMGLHRTRVDTSGRQWYPPNFAKTPIGAANHGQLRNITILRSLDPELARKGVANYQERIGLFAEMKRRLIALGVPGSAADELLSLSYSKKELGKAAMTELFSPFVQVPAKTTGPELIKRGQQSLDTLRANMDSVVASMAAAHNANVKNPKKAIKLHPSVQAICSTTVAYTGIPVSGGTPIHLAAPVDALRERRLKLVGHFRPVRGSTTSWVLPVLRIAPHVTRFAVAATATGALGAGLYALTKPLVTSRKNKAEAAR
jgi:hypothetical protein